MSFEKVSASPGARVIPAHKGEFEPRSNPGQIALGAAGAAWRLFLACWLPLVFGAGAVVVVLSHDPYDAPVRGDGAIFLHYGMRIADGEVPFRDFFDHKTPLGSYANGGAVLMGRVVGRDAVAAMHDLYLLVAAAIAVLTFGISRQVLGTRLGAAAATLFLLGYSQFGLWGAVGSSPKLLALAFGMGAWLGALHRRWGVSGLATALAFLCWQPGVLFGLVSAHLALDDRQRSTAKRQRAMLVLLGSFALPLLLLTSYFVAAQAFLDAIQQTVLFNSSYIQERLRSPGDALHSLWRVQRTIFADQLVIWLTSVPGFAAIVCKAWLGRRGRHEEPSLEPGYPSAERQRGAASVVVASVAILAASLINTAGHSDQVFYLPLVSILPAAALVPVLSVRVRRAPPDLHRAAVGVALLVFAVYGLAFSNSEPGGSLDRQRTRASLVAQAAQLDAGDPVVNMGAFGFAVLSNTVNVAKYAYTYDGVPAFVSDHDALGIEAYSASVASAWPKLIAYERQGSLHGFEEWLRHNYVQCNAPWAVSALSDSVFHRVDLWVRPDVATTSRLCRNASVIAP